MLTMEEPESPRSIDLSTSEDNSFEGFTSDDIAEAKEMLAFKVEEKHALQNYLLSVKDSISGASHASLEELEKFETSYGFEESPSVNSSIKTVKDSLKSRTQRTRQLNAKKFVLPAKSARSSRKIIPCKRYENYEIGIRQNYKNHSATTSFLGSSEIISTIGNDSPGNSQYENVATLNSKKNKGGLLDMPLIIEGKRPWKPSVKVQAKLSEMNYDSPFALKKGMGKNSETSSSYGSFKDIIKPVMVIKKPKILNKSYTKSAPENTVNRSNVMATPPKASRSKKEILSHKKSASKKEKVHLGPRIKYVSRSASTALGLPRAKFSSIWNQIFDI